MFTSAVRYVAAKDGAEAIDLAWKDITCAAEGGEAREGVAHTMWVSSLHAADIPVNEVLKPDREVYRVRFAYVWTAGKRRVEWSATLARVF
jgi:hypothetical protein